jgi:hypothetical protein
METDMTTNTLIAWTHEVVGKAHDLHILLLVGPELGADEREQLAAASPEVRRAARTITACLTPTVALPAAPELGPMLPLSDALRVLTSDEDWLDMSPDEADEVAREILIALDQHYDIAHLTPADVIAAMLEDPAEIDVLRYRCNILRREGGSDSSLARGLQRAYERARSAT